MQTAIDSVISVASGKSLKGTGVWSFIKVEGTPQARAAIATALVAIVALIANPGVVTAALSDGSINQ